MRMISAASVLLLLFLPAESCPPPEPPRRAARAPPGAPGPDPRCEPWPRRAAPPASPDGARGPPRRGARSPPSSRRKEARPSSLDLTFHLLREFLQMSREERLAQKARSNKWLLQNIGK